MTAFWTKTYYIFTSKVNCFFIGRWLKLKLFFKVLLNGGALYYVKKFNCISAGCAKVVVSNPANTITMNHNKEHYVCGQSPIIKHFDWMLLVTL